jgi:hypothetical protein
VDSAISRFFKMDDWDMPQKSIIVLIGIWPKHQVWQDLNRST